MMPFIKLKEKDGIFWVLFEKRFNLIQCFDYSLFANYLFFLIMDGSEHYLEFLLKPHLQENVRGNLRLKICLR